ncbi:HAD-IIA family hydrolase [Roseobacter sp. CCS2]|uniref:HAD-IIA family hydrolase n=1 Tax=Roseobacter sp. CCS2 TaxID=391593 RepID=UPI0000F3E276|nr:HAD hydrolase-like protein [Roseobacter sp. CCS2]EBA12222.1 Haloacid dehalogenase-like hydrolase [Roseobacter sp. CCS2]
MGLCQSTRSHHLTHGPIFDAYEAVRQRLPAAGPGGACTHARDLSDIADLYDVFLLDAFGVLNIGETAITGAPERIADLQAAGKRVLVVSNAAGFPHHLLMEKYARLGFDFAPDDVITSRKALLAALTGTTDHWGVMANPALGREDLETLALDFLEDDPATYDKAAGFLLIGSGIWTEHRQGLLEASLRNNPRPVHVGNPDIAAPREAGPSQEPGHWAHQLADNTGVEPVFHGKPYRSIYDLAFAQLGNTPGTRAVMVGDSLHTDILGGQTGGTATALIVSHGLLRDAEPASAIAASGIKPDHVLVTT